MCACLWKDLTARFCESPLRTLRKGQAITKEGSEGKGRARVPLGVLKYPRFCFSLQGIVVAERRTAAASPTSSTTEGQENTVHTQASPHSDLYFNWGHTVEERRAHALRPCACAGACSSSSPAIHGCLSSTGAPAEGQYVVHQQRRGLKNVMKLCGVRSSGVSLTRSSDFPRFRAAHHGGAHTATRHQSLCGRRLDSYMGAGKRWCFRPLLAEPRRYSNASSAFTTDGATAPAHGEGLYVSHYAMPEDARRLVGTPQLLPRNPAEEVAFKKNLIRSFPQACIRNVSVVAHVDHGKTTLSDAMLRFSNLLPADGATGTFTDRLKVEKERGITIKAQTCSVLLTLRETGTQYLVNLIDTPGHVDFQYEVSRSLCASEGAALLVDVRQGVEAQTMAQFYAALEQNLTILPVLTKMDSVMSDAEVEKTLLQLEDSTGLLSREVILTSAKSKRGIEQLFQHIIDKVPPPCGREGFSDMKQLPAMHPGSADRKKVEKELVPLRALLFDCWTSESSGMADGAASAPVSTASSVSSGTAPASGGQSVAKDGIYGLIRVMDGTVTPGTTVTFFHSGKKHEVREVGIIHPTLHPTAALTAGMVGFVFFPGLLKKDVFIGDTLCTLPTRKHTMRVVATGSPATASRTKPATAAETASSDDASGSGSSSVVEPIPGFKTVQPVVFAGFYPDEGVYITQLREAVDLLCVNDPSVTVEQLQCPALGPGLQLGFLGFLHMQVFKERLLMEFGQAVLVTPPQVQYMYVEQHGDPDDPAQRKPVSVSNWRWPHEGVGAYLEPFVTATVLTPSEYLNEINSAALSAFRGEMQEMRVIDGARTLVRYRMPLADLARGFFSTVKSSSHGYATLEYDDLTYMTADLVKMDIVINKAHISALSTICLRHEANTHARRIIGSLKEKLLRSSVDLPLQALVGSKIIARETVKAYRKDVTAKIHAGDISRKQKKWNDQKKGKERMARRSVGTVTLDQSVLAAALGATTAR